MRQFKRVNNQRINNRCDKKGFSSLQNVNADNAHFEATGFARLREVLHGHLKSGDNSYDLRGQLGSPPAHKKMGGR